MTSNALEELLPYYRRELTYLREMGAAFAEAYPKVAGRLEIGGSESPDPHVERLLESFAFLTARLQHNIESEFPKITTGLLEVLYPQFLRPVPSMTIAHFDVDPEQGKLLSGFPLKKHTSLLAQAHTGALCRFRTAYESVLWPFTITEAAFEPTARFDFLEAAGRVATVLRLRVACKAGRFEEFEVDTLRFHLAGDHSVATILYELIFAHVFQVVVLPQESETAISLPSGVIKPVGFGQDEAMLPYPPHAHAGYRLLQEYFTFPEKFLFFEIHDLKQRLTGAYVDVLILLDEMPRKQLAISPKHFMLNCVPIINLFPKTTEPIRVDQRQVSYRLVPDVRRERTTEIHSILKISTSSAADNETQTVQPYFSFDHRRDGQGPSVFWHARRGPPKLEGMQGTDLEVTFTDLAFRSTTPATQIVYAHTLCTNRRLPESLQDGTLLEIEVAAPVHQIYCLRKPTSPVDPVMGGASLWRLISHLSLNFLSLTEGKDSLQALREILRLYGVVSQRDVSKQLNGLRQMQTRRVMRRMGQEAWRGFCEGTEVTLHIDERNYSGGEGFLLASVLRYFLGLYASVNSFTELVAESPQREEIWKRWEPLAGEQIIL